MEMNLSALTDDELVRLFRRGNEQAFEMLVLRYKNSLYQYIRAMVKDEGIAGDLFQEVFLAFFKHKDSYRAEGKFKSWLFLTARNKVFNFVRDHKANVSLDQTDEDGNWVLQETLPDGNKPLLEHLTVQESAQRIGQAAEKLSPRQREVIYLRPYFSFKEIAQMVDRPLGTVLADCHRGVQKMQQILATQGDCL